jgi:hypothetical protein
LSGVKRGARVGTFLRQAEPSSRKGGGGAYADRVLSIAFDVRAPWSDVNREHGQFAAACQGAGVACEL